MVNLKLERLQAQQCRHVRKWPGVEIVLVIVLVLAITIAIALVMVIGIVLVIAIIIVNSTSNDGDNSNNRIRNSVRWKACAMSNDMLGMVSFSSCVQTITTSLPPNPTNDRQAAATHQQADTSNPKHEPRLQIPTDPRQDLRILAPPPKHEQFNFPGMSATASCVVLKHAKTLACFARKVGP